MRIFKLFSVVIVSVVFQVVGAVATAADPKVSEPKESIKGDPKEVEDLTVTPVKLRSKTVNCMFWADEKGTAFYVLDPAGVIQLVSFPELTVTKKVDVEKKCGWLAPSAQGLVLTVGENQEVWVIEPESGKIKKKIAVPKVGRAVCAASLSVAFANSSASRDSLMVLDLVKGKSSQYEGKKSKFGYGSDLAIAPDGKHLVTRAFETMHSYSIKDGKLSFAESSPRVAQGRVDIGTQFSADSKFVALPCYPGNYASKGLLVFPTGNMERPEANLQTGTATGAFSADPASGKFYTYAGFVNDAFNVFDGEGKLLKSYKLGAGEPQQMLVHPAGGKLLLMGKGKFLLIEMPK